MTTQILTEREQLKDIVRYFLKTNEEISIINMIDFYNKYYGTSHSIIYLNHITFLAKKYLSEHFNIVEDGIDFIFSKKIKVEEPQNNETQKNVKTESNQNSFDEYVDSLRQFFDVFNFDIETLIQNKENTKPKVDTDDAIKNYPSGTTKFKL